MHQLIDFSVSSNHANNAVGPRHESRRLQLPVRSAKQRAQRARRETTTGSTREAACCGAILRTNPIDANFGMPEPNGVFHLNSGRTFAD